MAGKSSRTQSSDGEIEALKKNIRKPGSTPWVKIGAYGVNGSGKTRLAGSAPKVLIVDCNEEGDRSIAEEKQARVVPARAWQDIGTAYWYLKSGRHPFESVAIDTITGMQDLAMDFVLNEAEERDPTRERSSPTKRDYGRTGTLMRGMLYAYRNLPMHVIFLAQERRIRDQDTEEVLEITMDLPAGSRGAAMTAVSVLGRMEQREVTVRRNGKKIRVWQHQLQVGPHEIIMTKDRTNAIGPIMTNPTMSRIIDLWALNPPTEEED